MVSVIILTRRPMKTIFTFRDDGHRASKLSPSEVSARSYLAPLHRILIRHVCNIVLRAVAFRGPPRWSLLSLQHSVVKQCSGKGIHTASQFWDWPVLAIRQDLNLCSLVFQCLQLAARATPLSAWVKNQRFLKRSPEGENVYTPACVGIVSLVFGRSYKA